MIICKRILIAFLMLLSIGWAVRFAAAHGGRDAGSPRPPAPKLFAAGVINTPDGDKYGPAFTPDGQTLYFAKRVEREKMEHIHVSSRQRDGQWSRLKVAAFSGKYFDKEPFVSPDGKRLFFASQRPLPRAGAERGDFNIWMAEKTAQGWAEPQPLPPAVNAEDYENYPSVSANGTLYFSSKRPGGKGRNDLYRARLVQGQYTQVEPLAELNTPDSDADPYIAPDESYMIISSDRDGTYGEGDLYITFNRQGVWTEPRNLGPAINSDSYEYTPLVSPDRQLLFFSRGWGEIYQIELSEVDLKPGPTSGQPSAAPSQRRVAVTIDDLPFTGDGGKYGVETWRELTAKLLESLKANKVPAIGFVNGNKLERAGEQDARTALLRMWLEAGMELGNHTYSHQSFYDTPLATFQEEVTKGERVTRALLAARGMKLRYFRHPFLNTGPDLATKQAFEKFLAERGYTIAPVTIDNMEWIFAREYTRARQVADAEAAQRIAAEYVPYMEQVFEFYEQLSRETFGYEPPQTLLIHANALNAEHFNELAAMMKRRGYAFITLEEALKDKAYDHRDTYTGPAGISWLQRWLITRGGQFRKEPYLPPSMRRFDSNASGSDFKTRKGN